MRVVVCLIYLIHLCVAMLNLVADRLQEQKRMLTCSYGRQKKEFKETYTELTGVPIKMIIKCIVISKYHKMRKNQICGENPSIGILVTQH